MLAVARSSSEAEGAPEKSRLKSKLASLVRETDKPPSVRNARRGVPGAEHGAGLLRLLSQAEEGAQVPLEAQWLSSERGQECAFSEFLYRVLKIHWPRVLRSVYISVWASKLAQ